jgi:hypothetical protein
MDVPMYILTRGEPLEKSKDKIYRIQSPSLEKKYTDLGYKRHERIYKLTYMHSDYHVYCIEFRSDKKGLKPVLLMPEFLIFRRPYPLEVYLYAIDLYSSNPDKGQRWTAEKTRNRFGLATFAHTTVGRALKAFVRVLDELTPTSPSTNNEQTDEPDKQGVGSQPLFPTVTITAELRKRAGQFLRGVIAQSNRLVGAAASNKIAREWFNTHGRLLL